MLNRFWRFLIILSLLSLTSDGLLRAQQTFKELPGYEKYREVTGLRTELAGG